MLVAVFVVARVALAGRPGRTALRWAAAPAVVAVAAALTLGGLAGSAFYLNTQRKAAVGSAAGVGHCVGETGSGGLLPFIAWLKASMPADAHYWLAPSPLILDLNRAPSLDPLCMALELLPDLPESSPADAQWIVTTGSVPAGIALRIARHDPTVRVLAPGYALAKVTAQ